MTDTVVHLLMLYRPVAEFFERFVARSRLRDVISLPDILMY